jgi:UDP-N-acetyl-D-mannosaminuronate dehydrogenase
MREHWTLQQYVDELMKMARQEFDQSVPSWIIDMKLKVLRREMQQRFSQEEIAIHGIVFEKEI